MNSFKHKQLRNSNDRKMAKKNSYKKYCSSILLSKLDSYGIRSIAENQWLSLTWATGNKSYLLMVSSLVLF